MFFMDKRIFEALSLNFKALRQYFPEILVCMLVAAFIKYIGVFSFFGMVLSLSFGNAMIYALYRKIFVEEQTKTSA